MQREPPGFVGTTYTSMSDIPSPSRCTQERYRSRFPDLRLPHSGSREPVLFSSGTETSVQSPARSGGDQSTGRRADARDTSSSRDSGRGLGFHTHTRKSVFTVERTATVFGLSRSVRPHFILTRRKYWPLVGASREYRNDLGTEPRRPSSQTSRHPVSTPPPGVGKTSTFWSRLGVRSTGQSS